MAFGTTPISTTTLGANQFPASAVASPDTPSGNLTALAGAPGAYQDSNSNQATAAMMQIATPRIVQSAHNVTGAGGKTLTCAFTNNNIKGNSVVVCVGLGEVEIGGGSPITLAITDSNSNTYIQAVKASQSTTQEAAIFYAVNVASGANTITVTIAGSGSSNTAIAVEIYEVYGLVASTPNALDQTATGSNAGSTAVATSTVSPLLPNEIAFTAIAAAGGTVTAGTSWTLDSGSLAPTGGNLVSFGSESFTLSTLGAITATATLSVSNAWAAASATFKNVSLPVEARVQGAFTELASLSAGALNADLVPSIDVSAYKWLSLQINTNAYSGTMTFQASNDNVNFVSILLMREQTAGTPFISASTTNGTNLLWTGPIFYRYLRVRMTSYASGAAQGTLELYATPPPFPYSQVFNTSATGVFTFMFDASGNPVSIGQAAMASSLPVTLASDQSALLTPKATTTGGTSDFHLISTASTNATSIKAGAGQVYGWSIYNTNAAARYVKLFNKASAPTLGTDTPFRTIGIPPSGSVHFHNSVGLAMGTGIALATTTGIADSDTAAVGASDLAIDIDWK